MSDLLIIIFGTGVFALAGVGIYLSFSQQRIRFRYEMEDRYEQRKLEEYRMKMEQESTRDSESQERVVGRVVRELEMRVAQLENSLNSATQAATGRPQVFIGDTAPVGPGTERMLRQLSHSMGTPLSRIKADALALGQNDTQTKRMVTAVDLANAYLTAFRQLAAIDDRGGIFDQASLRQTALRICDVYANDRAEAPTVTVTLPESIAGYGTTFLLAVIAPLIENAFEACPPGGDISIGYSEEGLRQITVANTYVGPDVPPDAIAEGRTTKPDHEGLGLSTVAALLRSRRGGQLDLRQDDEGVTVTVTLGD